MNAGKKFENAFKVSVDKEIYYERLKDPAQSFIPSENLRFSPSNPYDCFLFYYPNLFTFELKSTGQNSITFYDEKFVIKGKKQSFMVKKNQIKGLLKSSQHKGIISGLILNFRKTNCTYFLHIDDFVNMVEDIGKKSFNEQDVIKNNGHKIKQTLKRVNYRYHIMDFISELQEKYNQK